MYVFKLSINNDSISTVADFFALLEAVPNNISSIGEALPSPLNCEYFVPHNLLDVFINPFKLNGFTLLPTGLGLFTLIQADPSTIQFIISFLSFCAVTTMSDNPKNLDILQFGPFIIIKLLTYDSCGEPNSICGHKPS